MCLGISLIRYRKICRMYVNTSRIPTSNWKYSMCRDKNVCDLECEVKIKPPDLMPTVPLFQKRKKIIITICFTLSEGSTVFVSHCPLCACKITPFIFCMSPVNFKTLFQQALRIVKSIARITWGWQTVFLGRTYSSLLVFLNVGSKESSSMGVSKLLVKYFCFTVMGFHWFLFLLCFLRKCCILKGVL